MVFIKPFHGLASSGLPSNEVRRVSEPVRGSLPPDLLDAMISLEFSLELTVGVLIGFAPALIMAWIISALNSVRRYLMPSVAGFFGGGGGGEGGGGAEDDDFWCFSLLDFFFVPSPILTSSERS